MKEKFKVFYELSEQQLSEVWSSEDTIFIFDTNILLNLYQYSEETQNEFFKILNIVQDRIWIPFHVALEYQRRRLDVIRDEKAVFRKIDEKLNGIKDMVGKNFSEFKLKARNPDLFDLEEKFKKEIFSLVDVFKVEVEKVGRSQPCVRSHDEIRAKLDNLLEGKVGNEPDQDWVLQVTTEGAIRYENEVPPGYKDVSKDRDASKASFVYNNIKYDRKFGDLIIWKQILEHTKSLNEIKNVIFITDDSKEDWWEIVDSGGKKNIGARPELKSEIYREAEVDSFKMYHTNDFLTSAKDYFGIAVDNKAIEETEDLFNSLKFRNLLQEKLFNLHQQYSEAIHNEASLEERLNNLKAHSKSLSNEGLYHLEHRYSEAKHNKESLRKQLMDLQQRCFEVEDRKESLRKRLIDMQADSHSFSEEQIMNLQQRCFEADNERTSLGEKLTNLQQRYYAAAQEQTSLEERLSNLQADSNNFNNEELYHLEHRYSEAVHERSLLEKGLANLENNYAEIIRKKF